ncbi:MAG: hypothetical protein RR547_06595 [Raoultibacter sp.]
MLIFVLGVLCCCMLSPSLSYADRAPEDLDTNYEPARNQVINTLYSSRGGDIGTAAEVHGITEEEIAAQAAAAEEAARVSAEAAAAAKAAGPVVSPEVVQADPLRIGAWFVENDKTAVYQARKATADTDPSAGTIEATKPFPEEVSGMMAWMQTAFLMLAGAALCGALAAVLFTKAYRRTAKGKHIPTSNGNPITEKTVR